MSTLHCRYGKRGAVFGARNAPAYDTKSLLQEYLSKNAYLTRASSIPALEKLLQSGKTLDFSRILLCYTNLINCTNDVSAVKENGAMS